MLPNGTVSEASAISADGSTVVGTTTISANERRSFRWTFNSGMEALGVPPGSAPYSAWANGVSGDGSTVVGYHQHLGSWSAVRWDNAGTIEEISNIPTAGMTLARSVSSDGTVIVGDDATAEGWRGFRWSHSGPVTLMEPLQSGGTSSASAVSANGLVVVGSNNSHAVRWSQAGVQPLGSPAPGTSDAATCTNIDGSVIAGATRDQSTGSSTAFRWTDATGIIGLGTVAGFSSSYSKSMNSDGTIIVGTCSNPSGPGAAFIWTEQLGMTDLSQYFSSLGMTLGGWNLLNATGISADGRVITGTGQHDGIIEAWVAVIPAPSVLVALGVGALWNARRTRR